ncbi:dcedd2da-beb5-4c7e-85f6-3e85df43df87 [Thermothielavioides terrestris]|uniref:Endoplasmic reticulum junction formation protein lunapark n=2 Tax=Thermothielavioides terrestris TaxID=2587410 RepID=G2R1W7_THETT|nr:uncharacterized protein THITE_2111334 [Thermothielavioides terrestris NRRL 8126]AEO64943.1 hypothetical protein THITE_2111334 [Thermothielavioides terrestris NRRL 8126]SPQ19800.1 dcedd2da-beb5-4c7e-85f6-3e85df43df87 [Thermothielavioides terrestris]
MVSFWPWRKDDSSPASFEKALSGLAAKITATQAQLDRTRARSRRVKLLCTLYLGFAYLVYGIVLVLVVGWRNMGSWEWTGLAGGPVVISLVRAVTTAFFDYSIERLSARLKEAQAERAKTIQKLKDATKYDSTLELLEKYGGAEHKQKERKDTADEDEGVAERARDGRLKGRHARLPQHTNMPPPPTANIPRPAAPGLGTPQSRPQSRLGPPSQPALAQPDMEASAEFAPNAFDGGPPPPPPAFMQYPPAAMGPPAETHWYDRILDALLGEDETAAKNRIVLICSKCRLVNGQAPPGTKSLSELGMWKCMACGATNGEMDEGTRIVQEVLGDRGVATKTETADENASRSSEGELVEVDKDVPEANPRREDSAAEGPRKRRGKGNN